MDGIDAQSSLCFSLEQMADLTPFYFCVNREFAIVQMGRGLQQLYPDVLQGIPMRSLFEADASDSFVFDSTSSRTPQVCTVQCVGHGLRLQGTVVQEHQQDLLVFIGAPVEWLHGDDSGTHSQETTHTATGSLHQQVETLLSLFRIFGITDNIDDIALRVMETLGVLSGWMAGAFWLVRDGEQAFSCVATWHKNLQKTGGLAQALTSESIPMTTMEVRVAIDTGRVGCIGLDTMESAFAHGKLAVHYGVQSICVVPIYSKGQAIGMYEFFHSDALPHAESGMEVMMEAGRQTGVWITSVRAERELRTALEHEREINALKTRFMSMMSHDFRTPLTAILSSADLMEYLSDKLSAEQRGEYLGFIREAVVRMTTLLDHIRFIRKAEERQIVFSPTVFNISQFCDKLLQTMREQDGGQHVLRCVVQGSEENVRADSKLLWEICTHLLSNALKYSPAGAEVSVRVTNAGKVLEIEVEDAGIGIPKGEQKELFTPFFRATNVGIISGVGLGLFIVKHAVELHKGVIHVISEQGEGAAFTVFLPLEY